MVPITYNLRSLTVRRATTLATAAGIALVVFVLSAVMMLSAGIQKTMSSSGDPNVAIVLRKGADTELSSFIDSPNVGLTLASRHVLRRADGAPAGVGEIVVVAVAQKLGADSVSNVQLRGVPDDVYDFRPQIRVVEGRKARPGTDECVIGRAIRGRFVGFELGRRIELRKNRKLEVVGILDAGGSSFESEVWAGLDTLRAAFGRDGLVSSVRARLSSPAAFAAFERELESNRRLDLDVHREVEYYLSQSEITAKFVNTMGTTVSLLFSIGAMIGAMITMYAAVANRRREIGVLRALGFSRASILFSFLLEATLLAAAGASVGAIASLALGFVRYSVINMQSWSEMVFRFEPSLPLLITAVLFGAAMGVLGGFFPAVRAARQPLITALKG